MSPKWASGFVMLPVCASYFYWQHVGRIVLPKWPIWRHLFYPAFYCCFSAQEGMLPPGACRMSVLPPGVLHHKNPCNSSPAPQIPLLSPLTPGRHLERFVVSQGCLSSPPWEKSTKSANCKKKPLWRRRMRHCLHQNDMGRVGGGHAPRSNSTDNQTHFSCNLDCNTRVTMSHTQRDIRTISRRNLTGQAPLHPLQA